MSARKTSQQTQHPDPWKARSEVVPTREATADKLRLLIFGMPHLGIIPERFVISEADFAWLERKCLRDKRGWPVVEPAHRRCSECGQRAHLEPKILGRHVRFDPNAHGGIFVETVSPDEGVEFP